MGPYPTPRRIIRAPVTVQRALGALRSRNRAAAVNEDITLRGAAAITYCGRDLSSTLTVTRSLYEKAYL
jgi:hypothetical protein